MQTFFLKEKFGINPSQEVTGNFRTSPSTRLGECAAIFLLPTFLSVGRKKSRVFVISTAAGVASAGLGSIEGLDNIGGDILRGALSSATNSLEWNESGSFKGFNAANFGAGMAASITSSIVNRNMTQHYGGKDNMTSLQRHRTTEVSRLVSDVTRLGMGVAMQNKQIIQQTAYGMANRGNWGDVATGIFGNLISALMAQVALRRKEEQRATDKWIADDLAKEVESVKKKQFYLKQKNRERYQERERGITPNSKRKAIEQISKREMQQTIATNAEEVSTTRYLYNG